MVKSLRFVAILIMLLAPVDMARADSAAGAFVGEFADRAISLATDKSKDADTLRSEFTELLDTYFDMPAIGRFLLGRWWRSTSPEDREAYLQAFTDSIVFTYTSRFDDYSGQKLVVDSAREDGRFEIVCSRIVDPNNGQDVRLDWRVIKAGDSHKIVDVIIEGVSMSVTQRQEYASVIQNNGGKVSALIEALNRQMAALKGGS